MEALLIGGRIPMVTGHRALIVILSLLTVAVKSRAMTDEALPQRDVLVMFDQAEAAGNVNVARKSKPIDARPAKPGEVIITMIAGEGEETRSKPAEAGDWVVRNRCPITGNEEYLVKAASFRERYEGPLSDSDDGGWRAFRPRGKEMRYFIVGADLGTFSFMAPWGEHMVACPGDAIVQDPDQPADTYRVAAAAFECSYEVLPPR
jgi:hypothetical protein